MLVLRRKAGEAIVLNGTITIHVLAVEGERVKLGISAPPEVVIVRSELLENQGQMPGSQPGQGPRENPRPPFRDGDNTTNGGANGNGRPGGDEGPNGRAPNAYSNGNAASRYMPRRRSYGEGVAPSPIPGSTRYR
ncbi:MAG TPA: carbon storage regulator [Ktedonobacterales bacterium]|jgi:carbon storage regulator|nr:carbon storage regulator [Ktedonobacterales bacterium]